MLVGIAFLFYCRLNIAIMIFYILYLPLLAFEIVATIANSPNLKTIARTSLSIIVCIHYMIGLLGGEL